MRPNPLLPVIVNVKTLGVNLPADYTRVFGVVSLGDTAITTGEYKTISKNSIDEIGVVENSYTDKFITSYFANNYQGSLIVLEVGEDIEEGINILESIVEGNEIRAYEWACPTSFYNNDKFIELVKSYAGLTQAQYFSIELPKDIIPSIDDTFKKYLASKSFIPVISSTNDKEASNGALMGIKSSYLYDLNANTPLSPLQWKKVIGITPDDLLPNSMIDIYNQNGCNWVSSFNKNIVVFGGMVGDGKSWEYYFALDTFLFRITVDLGAMMIRGSNAPAQAVRFNQQGIDMIKNKLTAVSNIMAQYYVISEFGADYDSSANSITKKGEWACVDYASYKADSYDKWKEGIYDGASVYLTLGNFILQIVPSITIE